MASSYAIRLDLARRMSKESVQAAQRPASSVNTDQEAIDFVLVSFEPNDPTNPHNWKKVRRPRNQADRPKVRFRS